VDTPLREQAAGEKDRAEKDRPSWHRFIKQFLATLLGTLAVVYVFVLLVDPYDVIPFSLPIERRIVSISQRYMYPQIVRSRKFESFLIGSSASRLIDPQLLNAPFNSRFANLSMDSMTPWEQVTMVEFVLREAGPPKVLVFALEGQWCNPGADRNLITFRGFPEWLYDDNPWNKYPYLLNYGTVEIAVRMVGNRLGLYPERLRYDGFGVFVPPDSEYDLERARRTIWAGRTPEMPPALPPPMLSEEERRSLSFPAVGWLDATLAKLPASTLKILAQMPVHVAAQPWPGTRDAAVDEECKARIAAIARARGAKLIDWRIVSPLTTNDANYWDRLHYRLPIGNRIAADLAAAVLDGRESEDHAYRLVVR
jgi:hypothetical protein